MTAYPVRRLASPSGFVLAALSLLLPFVIGSCSAEQLVDVPPQQRQAWQVTYTGVDLLSGGVPEVEIADHASQGQLKTLGDGELARYVELTDPPVPFTSRVLAWLAFSLLAIGVVLVVRRQGRGKAWAAAGLAVAAAAALLGAAILARQHATDAVAEVLRQVVGGGRPGQQPPPVRQWEAYPAIKEMFRLGYGFWIAMGILSALTAGNVVQALGGRLSLPRRARSAPAPAAPDLGPPEAPPPPPA